MPYTTPDFNGLAFGDRQGSAVLFIIPLYSRENHFSTEEAFTAAREWLMGERKVGGSTAFMGWIDSKKMPDWQPTWTGVIGRGEDLSILFRWKNQFSVIDALQEIETAEGGIPAWLCSAMQTASYVVERGLDPLLAASAVYFSAKSCARYPQCNKPEFLSRKELEKIVDTTPLSQSLDLQIPGLKSGTDYSRFSMLLGSRLLDEKWYRPKRQTLQVGEVDRLSFFAAAKLCLDPQPKIQYSYIPLRIRLQSGKQIDPERNIQQSSTHIQMESAFALYDFLIQSSPPPAVLRAFFPEGVVDVSSFRKTVELFNDLKSQNHPAAIHLANSLIDEADSKASYAPQGMYRVLLPEELPLSRKGVTAINIYFDSNRLWVQMMIPDPCPTIIPWNAGDFRKDPEEFPYSFSLMMSAIWRDFRVSAEDSFPEEAISRSTPPEREFPLPSTGPHVRVKGGDSVRMLPVARRGRLVWGYQVEREYIARRPHLVGAFRRRLPEEQHRREDALTLAAEFGIVLPDEHFTVVQPHARGGRSVKMPNTENAPVVRSRGLAASFAYTNFLKEIEGKVIDPPPSEVN